MRESFAPRKEAPLKPEEFLPGEALIDTEGLCPAGFSSPDLFRSPKYPGKIVRREVRFDLNTVTSDSLRSRLSTAEEVLSDLDGRPNMNVASFSYHIGIDGDSEASYLYTVVDEVNGESLDRGSMDLEKFAAVDRFLSDFVSDIWEKFEFGKPYWSEYKNEQVVFGTVRGDAEPKCYIVDVEPLYREFRDRMKQSREEQLLRYLDHIYTQGCMLEKRDADKPLRLDRFRESIRSVVEKVSVSDGDQLAVRLRDSLLRLA